MENQKETCPKCDGAGDLPPFQRGNHPSLGVSRKCLLCLGLGEVSAEKARSFREMKKTVV